MLRTSAFTETLPPPLSASVRIRLDPPPPSMRTSFMDDPKTKLSRNLVVRSTSYRLNMIQKTFSVYATDQNLTSPKLQDKVSREKQGKLIGLSMAMLHSTYSRQLHTDRRHPISTESAVFIRRSTRSCCQTAYCWTPHLPCRQRSHMERPIPVDVTSAPSLSLLTFRKRLKLHLFRLSYPGLVL